MSVSEGWIAVNTPSELTGGAVHLGDREVHVADALDVLLDVLGIEILVVTGGNQADCAAVTGGQAPTLGSRKLLVR